MKKTKTTTKRISAIALLIIILFSLFVVPCLAHSGRTDSHGGHHVSATGEYHYHCGGHPAHQHKNGVCPYDTEAEEEPKGGGLLYKFLMAGVVGVSITGIVAMIKWIVKKVKNEKESSNKTDNNSTD